MKILLVCVNYNSYAQLGSYIESISYAKKQYDVDIDICIGDNSTNKENVEFDSCIGIRKFDFDNVGYFGAAFSIINGVENLKQYDYVFISNVDLTLTESFFRDLDSEKISGEVAWVAPKIISSKEKLDRNPKIIERLSKRKIRLLELFYKFPFLMWLYEKTMYKKRQTEKQDSKSGNIYAGHGSFIMLTRKFFECYQNVTYPIFLFGEEIFLAELIRNKNLKVYYTPNIVVNDLDHVSTGTMKRKSYYQENYKAINYIRKTFYE